TLHQQMSNNTELGPGYFPKILAVGLIIFCLLSLLQTRKEQEKKISLPHVKTILVTIGITIVFFLSWKFLGLFYLNTFLYLLVLFIYYNPNKKKIVFYCIVALFIVLLVYGF